MEMEVTASTDIRSSWGTWHAMQAAHDGCSVQQELLQAIRYLSEINYHSPPLSHQ